MAGVRTLDATQVYEKLQSLGHDYAPEKQAYKSTIAGDVVYLFDRQGNPSRIGAAYTQQVLDGGGFWLTREAWEEANGLATVTEPETEEEESEELVTSDLAVVDGNVSGDVVTTVSGGDTGNDTDNLAGNI